MCIKKSVVGVLGFALSTLSHAGTMGPSVAEEGAKSVVTLSGGPVWPTGVNGNHSVYFSPELSRTYTIDNSTRVLGEGEVFAGIQRPLNPSIDGQLGIVFAAASKLNVSGSVWDFEDPRFNNYRHSYTIQPNRIALGGKLIRKTHPVYEPWINASIGLSINKATNYRETSTECEVVVLPESHFSSHTTTSFTYSVGVGIQRVLTPNWQVGVGYEFTDWGRSQLAAAPTQAYHNKGLTLNHLYTNGLLFNLTWTA